MLIIRTATLILFTPFVVGAALAAQQVQPAPRQAGALPIEEATTITQGWAFLAQGDFKRAAEKARAALTAGPRSAAALVLGVEVEIALSGAHAALDVYERWLGARTLEEPAVVRRVAEALLREMAADPKDSGARFEALAALAAAGDAAATATLSANASAGTSAEARILARLGNPQAVRRLVGELKAGGGNEVMSISALGESRSRLAIEPLTAKLRDPRSEVRGEAADALGRIGEASVVPQLKSLLTDQSSYVRVRAAGALYRLDDPSGTPVLQDHLAASESSAAGRLVAAEVMASRPDAQWLSLVRGLLEAGEPHIRLAAARLIAPHDAAAAQSVLSALGSDPNPAIRDEAGRILAGEVVGNLPALRAMLRHPDASIRLRAAGRILELTA